MTRLHSASVEGLRLVVRHHVPEQCGDAEEF